MAGGTVWNCFRVRDPGDRRWQGRNNGSCPPKITRDITFPSSFSIFPRSPGVGGHVNQVEKAVKISLPSKETDIMGYKKKKMIASGKMIK